MNALSLTELAQDLLATARQDSAGRATRMLHGGRGRSMQQMVLALTAGQDLAEHENPGEATLQMIRGEAELRWGDDSVTLRAGEHVVIPAERHSLHAGQDCVVLLSLVSTG